MRSLYRASLLLALAMLLLVGSASPVMAAQVESSDLVIITEGDVVTDDLYVAANRVLIRGKVDGDLVAVAGQDIRIEGEVTGSITVLAPEVVIEGSVGGAARIAAPTLTVTGSVGRDLVVLVGSVDLSTNAGVAGDIVMWAWNAGSRGRVGGDIEGTLRNLDLSGKVSGDVRVTVNDLSIGEMLEVDGDLTYRSGSEAESIERATVGGAVVKQSPMAPNIRIRALFLTARILAAIVLTAVALLVASAWPERTESALRLLSERPKRAFGYGLAIVASPLLIVAIAALVFALAPASAAIPLIAALIPVLFATLGILMAVGLVAGIPVLAWVGSKMRPRSTISGAVGLGALVVALLWAIPYLGWIVALVVITVGIGSWVSAFRDLEPPQTA